MTTNANLIPTTITDRFTLRPISFNGGHTNLASAGLTFDCVSRRPQRRCTEEMILHAWRLASGSGSVAKLVKTAYGWAPSTEAPAPIDFGNGGIIVTPAGDVYDVLVTR